MIIIKNSGVVEPLGIRILRESKLQLTAPTRNITDSADEFDGEIDFGTELKNGSWVLVGVTDEGLSATDKMQVRRNLATHINNLRINGAYIAYESDPDKKIFVKTEGRAEIEEYPTWLKVHIPLKVDPLWVSTNEQLSWNTQQSVGLGDVYDPNYVSETITLFNTGTTEAPIILELKGPAINPEIIVGGETLKYIGILTTQDILTINTEHGTVKFNNVNALANYVGSFPHIPPGENTIFYDGDGQLMIKMYDRWI